MAIRCRVRNDKLIIVPIRFVRAVTGAPVLDAPEVDDRGFVMGPRTPSWGISDARGAMVGITARDTIRVKVLREDIDAAAPLYATSTDTGAAEVGEPAGGGLIPADGIFSIRGVADLRNRPVAIQVRYGAIDGPVLGELEPHIFLLRSLRVRVHLVTIDGVSTNRTQDSMVAHFAGVNNIWRPCGIEFDFKEANKVANTRNEVIRGHEYRRRDGTWRNFPGPLGPAGTYRTAGTVTTNLGGAPWDCDEFSTLLQVYPANAAINLYCVRFSDDLTPAHRWIGLTYDKDIARPNGYGVVIRDDASIYDTAHELGHFLNLDNHADVDATDNTIHQDMWIYRRLMVNGWPPAAPPHRHDVGYGGGQYGPFLTVKNLPNELWDDEVAVTRRRARNPY